MKMKEFAVVGLNCVLWPSRETCGVWSKTDREMDRERNRETHTQVERKTGRETERQTGREKEGQTGKETDR